jgi:hypothetical protein
MMTTMYMHECVANFERSESYCPDWVESRLPEMVTHHQTRYIHVVLVMCRSAIKNGAEEFEFVTYEEFAREAPDFGSVPQ